MKRWGLRASSLSAVAKADAGQKTSNKYLNPNVLYMMLAADAYSILSIFPLADCLNLLFVITNESEPGISLLPSSKICLVNRLSTMLIVLSEFMVTQFDR